MSLLLPLWLGACGYYGQSISGQLELLAKRRPLTEVLADARTSPALRHKLEQVQAMRRFASEQLALPDNGSYASYADIGRPYVVWNVFAAKPLDLQLNTWCFPVAGCVGYRGYFSEAAARDYAASLAEQGFDTYVGGVAAYSTLGWFDDPLLSTVVGRPEPSLAGLLFHELAHQRLYVAGDTAFNEGFATTVELEGVRRWLAAEGEPGQLTAYAEVRARRQDFVALVSSTRERLKDLYARSITEPQKLAGKQAIIARLREEYRALKQRWGGYGGYDQWFAGPLNNAQLAAVAAYRDNVPAFQVLLARQGGDLAAFYRAAQALGELPEPQRQAALADLAGSVRR